MTPLALAEDVKARRNREAAKDLESILIAERARQVQREIGCVERVLLEWETEVLMNIGRAHG
jgi:hypothetical protein